MICSPIKVPCVTYIKLRNIFSDKLLPKILLLKEHLPYLKTIVVFNYDKTSIDLDSFQDDFMIVSFDDIESRGSEAKKNNTKVFKTPSSNDPAVIMYTSGSTGTPKAQFGI